MLTAIEKLGERLLEDATLRAELDLTATEEEAIQLDPGFPAPDAVSYTHLRAHETVLDLVCRLLLENKKKTQKKKRKDKKTT